MADQGGDGRGGQRAAQGVVFPLVDGARSTTATGRAVLADAARSIDPALADAISGERRWRTGYLTHVRALVEAELRAGDRAVEVPRAGLASLHRRFEFVRGGDTVPLATAVAELGADLLRTVEVRGRGPGRPDRLRVPYRGELLEGDALKRQLDRWVAAGVVEPSFAEGVRRVVDDADWLDLGDRAVLVAGAGAEMGPLEWLCRWNATVIAVDRAIPALWGRVLAAAREGSGRMLVPVRGEGADADAVDEIAAAAGADLVTELPEVARWLDGVLAGADVDPARLTVGNYVYADGGLNVQVSMAVDALTDRLCAREPGVSLAVLATPTDVFAVPEDTVEDSRRRLEAAGVLPRVVRSASGGRLYVPNHGGTVGTPSGRSYGVADALVPQQGPNYVLAKRLHRWRARAGREAGRVSSINVAPPTRTRSVVSNRLLAAAYAGAPAFGVEVFEPDTSRALMAALLVHDLRDPGSSAHPGTPLGHPLELLSDAAAHGGLWRMPFAPRSVLGLAAVRGLVRLPGR